MNLITHLLLVLRLRMCGGTPPSPTRMHGMVLSTGYCYGVVLYKTSHALWPFYDLLCVPIWVLIIPDSSTRALWQIPAETPSSKAGKTWRKLPINFAGEVSLSHFAGTLICCKIYEMGLLALLPLNEVKLQIFIALKNPSSSAGFEPANLGFNSRHIH
jgi:hypothetical protein